MCCKVQFFRGCCWKAVGRGGRPVFPGSAGGRREQKAGGKPGHPQEPMPASGAKATNFASYNRAVPLAAAAGHLRLPGLISDSKAVWR